MELVPTAHPVMPKPAAVKIAAATANRTVFTNALLRFIANSARGRIAKIGAFGERFCVDEAVSC